MFVTQALDDQHNLAGFDCGQPELDLRAVDAGLRVGVRFVVVDDPAAGFYRAHGFKPIPGDPHRLVRKASSIAADLDE